MNFTPIILTHVLLVLLPFSGISQNFVNGGLESSFSPWENVLFSENFCSATSAGLASPDLTSINGPWAITGVLGIPNSGQTFASGLLASISSLNVTWHEGIKQTVAGFVVDSAYSIHFFQTVVKQYYDTTNPSYGPFYALDKWGGWSVYVDGILIGNSDISFSGLSWSDPSLIWEERQIVFTATNTSHTISFLPWDDDPIIESVTEQEGIRMGIDDISIEPINAEILSTHVNSKQTISLSPNPANNILKINGIKDLNFVDIKIVDLMGKQVESFIDHNGILNISGLAQGRYFVQIRSQEGSNVFDFIKE